MATKNAITLYTVPAGTPPARCKGPTCGKVIYFITGPNTGASVPVDCDCEGGTRPSETNDRGQLDAFSGGTAPVFDGKGCSHFLTCPDRDLFTRKPTR